MKRYIGLIVGFVAIAAGAGSLVVSKNGQIEEVKKEADAQRLRADYLEKVGWLRTNPDDKGYKDEVNPFFRNYFNQVDEHLKKFGGNADFDGYLTEQEGKKGAGKKGADAKAGDRKAVYDSVRSVFDRMREGKYTPVFTATDKGLRLDVLSADVKMVNGKPSVRYEIVVWGASRELREAEKNTKRMVTSASFSASWNLLDDKGKQYGSMEATDLSGKVDWPERYIAEFPPQMVLGHYDLDLLPAEVKDMEITFKVSSRASTGGEAAASFLWKLETPGDWKLKPGEKWEGASETTAPMEAPSAKK
ncbi:MAG TPA: hypothetical protein VIG99_20140 [Myxococcaceae bacterium]